MVHAKLKNRLDYKWIVGYTKPPKKLSQLRNKTTTAINKKQVFIGTSDEEASACWVKPSDINRTTGAWGSHKQWAYDYNTYLYFKTED